MTKEELIKALNAPFSMDDLEWKPQTTGLTKSGKPYAKIVAYVSARAIHQRLDEVFAPGGWMVEYNHLDKGVMCGLSVMCLDGSWVTKWDGAEETDIEPFKGGISSAMKRAAAVWGIGRYLYKLPEMWAQFVDKSHPGRKPIKIKDEKTNEDHWFFWRDPIESELPEWAIKKQ